MFFSVVSASPASRRRALSGGLVSGDLAIALHRTLCIDKAIGQVVLECVPAHLASKIMDGLNLSLGAMVLTPRLLPMSSFKSACRWAVKSDLLLRIEDDALAKAGAPVEDLDKSCLAELLHELIIGSGSSGTRGKLVIDVGDCKRDQFLGLLNAMHTAGLVSRFQVEHEEAVWSLTDTGMSTIQAGMTVADRVSMMIPRDFICRAHIVRVVQTPGRTRLCLQDGEKPQGGQNSSSYILRRGRSQVGEVVVDDGV